MLLAALLLALLHLDDRYMVGHVSGAWMGLAAAVGDGVVYPPAHEDGFFGGTRFMPVFFVLHGGLALLTDELLVTGKLLTLASAAGLVVLVLLLLRRRETPWPLAIGLAGALVASWAATSTVFGIRGDALAVLLQLGAVALVAERVTTGRAATAGVLSGLALFVKLSALWAPAAIVVWLALRSRRALLPFLAAFAVTTAALLVLFEAVSSGRLHENLRSFAFAGSGGETVERGARRLFELAVRDQRSLWPILVLAAVAAVLVLLRRPGIYELAFLAAGCILLVVLRDIGAYENHLLDVSVLAALVVGGAWSALGGTTRTVFRVCAVAAVLLATALAARHTLVPDLRAALEDGDDTRLRDAAAAQRRLVRLVRALGGPLATAPRRLQADRARRVHRPTARRGGRRGPPPTRRAARVRPHRPDGARDRSRPVHELRLHARDRRRDPRPLPARRHPAGDPALGVRARAGLAG